MCQPIKDVFRGRARKPDSHELGRRLSWLFGDWQNSADTLKRNLFEDSEVRGDGKVNFAKMEKDDDLEDGIGAQVDKFDLVMMKKTAKKFAARKPKSLLEKTLSIPWSRWYWEWRFLHHWLKVISLNFQNYFSIEKGDVACYLNFHNYFSMEKCDVAWGDFLNYSPMEIDDVT
jgi:hypothetical protein